MLYGGGQWPDALCVYGTTSAAFSNIRMDETKKKRTKKIYDKMNDLGRVCQTLQLHVVQSDLFFSVEG